jgi:outer membrane protein assembly factor BamA
MRAALCALALLALQAASVAAQTAPQAGVTRAPEVVAVVQIHGNNATPEGDILALAAVESGAPFTPDLPELVRRRLLDSGRFEGVEVRARFASLTDPSQRAVVIIIDEYPVRILTPAVDGEMPAIARRRWMRNAMFLPILDAEDGYGLTYGVLVAYPDLFGGRSRLAFPMSWGGHKRAAVEAERVFDRGPVSRVRAGATLERRRNPFYEVQDGRRRLWLRAERVAGSVTGGAVVAWEHVSFAGDEEWFRWAGVDVVFDTRLDPGMPRNAVYARAAWTRVAGQGTSRFDRHEIDLRGYVGLVRQAVVIARVEREGANRATPPAFKSLVGGWSSLRGFRAGAYAGDTRVVGSLELRVPLSPVLKTARTGVSVFADAGKVYDYGESFRDAPDRVGIGAGVWLSAPLVQAGVSVAHGRGSGTRVNVGIGLTF